MPLSPHLGLWDYVLVFAVSAQAAVLAYLYEPRLKALIWMLPIPFTLASLAVGRPVDATNILGISLLLLFTYGVRLLHQDARLPIVPAIVLSAGSYCLGGWALARVVSPGDTAFWSAAAATMAAGLLLLRITPHGEERGYRSPLPLWLKLPAIIVVVVLLMLLKRGLGGFTTVFPMVGVIGAYESRYSLQTMVRAAPGMMVTLVPLMAVCRLLQNPLGLPASLAVGWVVYLTLLRLLNRSMWRKDAGTGEAPD